MLSSLSRLSSGNHTRTYLINLISTVINKKIYQVPGRESQLEDESTAHPGIWMAHKTQKKTFFFKGILHGLL